MVMGERNDVFRVMDERIYASGQEDTRKRRYIYPQRILWTSGHVENSQALLQKRDMQISLDSSNACVMKSTEGVKASILLDYGVELHGGIRFLNWKDSTGRGSKVRIRFGESVSEAMSELAGEDNATNDHARRDMLVEVGSMSMNQIGETGFRFVRIDLEEPDADLAIQSICAVFIYKDVPYRGSFRCSDPLLNRIWDVGAYTVHLNMQEYIWDGVKRDRLVWIGDMHPEMLTIRSVFGEDPAVEKSLDFIRKETPLPNWMNGIPTYSMWYICILYDWFMYTGRTEILEKQREYLLGLMDLLSANIDEHGKNCIVGWRFLDWPTNDRPRVSDAGLQAMHILSVECLKHIFEVLGEEERVIQCENDLYKLRSCPQQYEDAKQAAALLVLAGMEDPEKINDSLLKVGGSKGMSTFMGYYILAARAMAGDAQGCLDSIREYWGGMLSLGATTFWEDFDVEWLENASRIDELPDAGKIDVHASYGRYCYSGLRHSFCHGWAGGVTPWLSEYVLGVKIVEPGCKKIKVKPHLGDLNWVEGTFPTPYGELYISHKKLTDGSVETKIDLPEGVSLA